MESTFTYQKVYINLYQISAYEQNENTSLIYILPLEDKTKHNKLYNRKIILFKGPNEELKEAMQRENNEGSEDYWVDTVSKC